MGQKSFCSTFAVISLLTSACVLAQTPLKSADIASVFIKAVNEKNVDAMMAVAETPFLVRNQQWEQARDGYGLVLGKTDDRVLSDPETLRSFLKETIIKVRVEKTTPAKNPPSQRDFLNNQLKGMPSAWSHLEFHVFLRRFGDVEHIALVGVDPRSNKVRALYLN